MSTKTKNDEASRLLDARRKKALMNHYKKKYVRNLTLELKNLTENNQPSNRRVIYVMDKDNIDIWYGLIFNIGVSDNGINEFANGEYILVLQASVNYPISPPIFKLLTPNGVYSKNSQPCVGIGHYHENAYPASLGMTGFGDSIVESMRAHKDLQIGISIVNTDTQTKLQLASSSANYNNINHNNLVSLFKEHINDMGIQGIVKDIKFK
jgi:ubiquitin-protein ligase